MASMMKSGVRVLKGCEIMWCSVTVAIDLLGIFIVEFQAQSFIFLLRKKSLFIGFYTFGL